jgi:hypothetical protein
LPSGTTTSVKTNGQIYLLNTRLFGSCRSKLGEWTQILQKSEFVSRGQVMLLMRTLLMVSVTGLRNQFPHALSVTPVDGVNKDAKFSSFSVKVLQAFEKTTTYKIIHTA